MGDNHGIFLIHLAYKLRGLSRFFAQRPERLELPPAGAAAAAYERVEGADKALLASLKFSKYVAKWHDLAVDLQANLLEAKDRLGGRERALMGLMRDREYAEALDAADAIWSPEFSRRLDSIAYRIRAHLDLAKRAKAPEVAFLGLQVEPTDLAVSREQFTVKFGRKIKAWTMFSLLHGLGDAGATREDINNALWPGENVGMNNADQQKKMANEILQRLRVEIVADKRGIWKLANV